MLLEPRRKLTDCLNAIQWDSFTLL